MTFEIDNGGCMLTQITLDISQTRDDNDDGCAISRFALFTTEKCFGEAPESLLPWVYFKNEENG